MWMSEARSATAWVIMRLTSLTMGASSTTSLMLARSSSASNSLDAWDETSWASVSRRWNLSMAASMEARVATTTLTSAPVMVRMSSMAKTLLGSAMASTIRPSSQATGRAW